VGARMDWRRQLRGTLSTDAVEFPRARPSPKFDVKITIAGPSSGPRSSLNLVNLAVCCSNHGWSTREAWRAAVQGDRLVEQGARSSSLRFYSSLSNRFRNVEGQRIRVDPRTSRHQRRIRS